MIILCFVIKIDNYAVAETTSSSTKSSMKNSLDDFCTTTINNSLNCKPHCKLCSPEADQVKIIRKVILRFSHSRLRSDDDDDDVNFKSYLHNSLPFCYQFYSLFESGHGKG